MAPLIVITGPTASGKSRLALELAERYNGEIVCADSRTVYKGMDIGTAKPTAQEQSRVPHHLLDVVEPDERYTAADFQADAYRCITAIRERGNTPFLVGGTGLYIDAVTREYTWPAQSDDIDKRKQLEAKSVEELHVMIKKHQLVIPSNNGNKRHLINTLLRNGTVGSARLSPQENTYVVAIATDKLVLEKRIQQRARLMFEQGVIEEAQRLAKRYGWDSESMSGNIYRIIRKLLAGELSQQEAEEAIVVSDRQLAKRQVTWLKRHNYVKWLDLDHAQAYIETILG